MSRAVGTDVFSLQVQGVLGRLELAQGNVEAAGRHLRDLPGRCLDGGLLDPVLPLWADAIETLVALGELDQARAYLVHFEENAERLGNPGPMGAAARCRGLLAAAEGDIEGALAAFERSLGELDGRFPLERGRTLLCLGAVRRQAQQKRAAREALEQALAVFEELGAPLWAEKARAELQADQRPASRRRGAHGDRAARGGAGGAGPQQQGDRRRAVHGREHGRGAPLPRLPQARDPLAGGARWPALAATVAATDEA